MPHFGQIANIQSAATKKPPVFFNFVLQVISGLGLESRVRAYRALHQPPWFKGGGWDTRNLRRRTEIEQVPVKDSHTRIKPLALASGHGRYGWVGLI
jgi:hypothetical protein